MLYNWTSLSQNVPKTSYRTQLGLTDKTVFCYAGNIGIALDMDNIIRLANAMKDRPDVSFLLVGAGSELPRLKQIISARGLTNVIMHPAVSQHNYLGMLSELDVGLITLHRVLKTQNFPGKMLGYMYFAMPILASINQGNDLRDILVQAGAGLVTFNGDDAGLLRNAVRLADNAELRHSIGNQGRHLLETTFSVSRAADQLLDPIGNT